MEGNGGKQTNRVPHPVFGKFPAIRDRFRLALRPPAEGDREVTGSRPSRPTAPFSARNRHECGGIATLPSVQSLRNNSATSTFKASAIRLMLTRLTFFPPRSMPFSSPYRALF